jgi:protein-arginine kinase activator protein McsA
MAHSITVKTQEDFEAMMKDNNYEISSSITKTILKNLKGRKQNLHVLEIKVLEEHTIYDITINRSDMLESLEKNLEIHVANEDYESCSKILEGINYLKNKK